MNININDYPEIKPGKKPIKKIYAAIMLFIVGRAMQAVYRLDNAVKEEFDNLRDDFLLQLWVSPNGPNMFVGKDKKGRIKYLGWNPKGKKVTLNMEIKNIEAAILLFTFQEGTVLSSCNDRLIVGGSLEDACAIVRVLDIVETYLLPKIITRLAVKRYPKWSQMNPIKKHLLRFLVYIRAFTV